MKTQRLKAVSLGVLTCCVSKLLEETSAFWSVKAQQYWVENATIIPFFAFMFFNFLGKIKGHKSWKESTSNVIILF